MNLVCKQSLFQVARGCAAGNPVLFEFTANIDGRPTRVLGSTVNQPCGVVEAITVHRVPPIEHGSDVVMVNEDVVIEQVTVDEVSIAWKVRHKVSEKVECGIERLGSDG